MINKRVLSEGKVNSGSTCNIVNSQNNRDIIPKALIFSDKINMERIVKAVWPFLSAEVIILLLMIFFPVIVTVPMNFFMG